MPTRRAILAGAAGLPFLVEAARAAASRNSRLLLCRLSLDRMQVRLDSKLKLGASLEARQEYVRIFTPLHWGAERGFRLELAAADGKRIEPRFYPPFALPPPDVVRSVASYRALDAGEQTGFSASVAAKDVFPAAGKYRVRAVYVPEPSRAMAPMQAIVFENGEVASDTVSVTVV